MQQAVRQSTPVPATGLSTNFIFQISTCHTQEQENISTDEKTLIKQEYVNSQRNLVANYNFWGIRKIEQRKTKANYSIFTPCQCFYENKLCQY